MEEGSEHLSMKSMKDKLRDRFTSVKQKSSDSLLKARTDNSRKKQSNVNLRLSNIQSRLESYFPENDQETEIHEALKNAITELNIKESTKNIKEKRKTEDDFFLSEVPVEDNEKVSKSETKLKQLGDILDADKIEKSKDTKNLSKKMPLDYFDAEMNVINKITATAIIEKNEFDKNVEKLFWDGTEHAVSKFGKVNPVELGYSIGQKPKLRSCSKHLKSVLSHTENASAWFDANGDIITSENLLQDTEQLKFTQDVKSEFLITKCNPVFLNKSGNYERFQNVHEQPAVLEIKIESLKFYHHPLFSIEHVLERKLSNCYDIYRRHCDAKIPKRQVDLLLSLRKKKNSFRKQATDTSVEDRKKIFKDEAFRSCIKEISQIRQTVMEEALDERQNEKMILSIWKTIKQIRNFFDIHNTEVVLMISKIELSLEEDRLKWEEHFEEEVSDEIDAIKCKYFESRTEYSEQKKKQKDDPQSPKSKLQKPMLEFDEIEIRTNVFKKMCESFRKPGEPKVMFKLDYNPETITKVPTSPGEINRRADVDKLKILIKCFINGKEVCKTKTTQLSQNFTVNINERYSIQLSESVPSLQLAIFEQTSLLFPVKVSEMLIQIPSKNIVVSNDIKDSQNFTTELKKDYQHFGIGTCNTLRDCIEIKHSQLKITGEVMEEVLKGNGQLDFKLGWDPDTVSDTTPSNSLRKKSKSIHHEENIPMIKLDALVNEDMDPNDPDNMLIFTFLNKLNNDEASENFYFDESINLCFDMDDQLNRYSKFNFEEKNTKIEKDLNVTGDTDDVSSSSIVVNTKKLGESVLDNVVLLKDLLDPVDLQRRSSIRYLQLVNDYLFLQKKSLNTDKQLSDIVTDFKFPGIKSITIDFLRPKKPLFHQTNQSAFVPKLYRNVVKNYTLKICILKAFQLPNRVNNIQTTDGNNSEEGLKVISLKPFIRVSCQGKSQRTTTAMGSNPTWNQQLCLSVMWNGKSLVSIHLFDELFEDLLVDDRLEMSTLHCQYGASWLASLEIPLFSIFSQNKTEGTFYMRSPPEILGYKQNHDDKFGNSHMSYDSLRRDVNFKQREGIFLSMYFEIFPPYTEIPPILSDNFESNEMDFMIRYLNLFIYNYNNQFANRKLNLLVVDTSGKNVCITRFFQAMPLPDFTECLQNMSMNFGNNDESMSSKSSTPNRKRGSRSRTEKDDIGSKSLKSASMEARRSSRVKKEAFEMKSLEENAAEDNENSLTYKMKLCLRFVSLIPVFEFHSSDNQCVVLTGLQILKLVCGSMTDHAILLMNYFLSLDVDCWFVCGHANSRGLSSYVLIRENNNEIGTIKSNPAESRLQLKRKIWRYYIYDATSRLKYDVKDSFCPLKRVNFACNNKNIWANIQAVERCDMTSFNFNNTSEWRPVFQQGHFVTCPGPLPDLSSTMGAESQYTYSTQDVQRLREMIEDRIKTKFQKWRGHRRTIFNRHCSNILKNCLQNLEKSSINMTSTKQRINTQLQQLQLSYQMYGFPLNVPYTAMNEIIACTKATQLHLNENSGVEFALAVEVFAYPNSVYSVWVYLASLLRK